MADQAQIDKVTKQSVELFEKNNPGESLTPDQLAAMRTSIEKSLNGDAPAQSTRAAAAQARPLSSSAPVKSQTELAAEQAKIDRLMKSASEQYQKDNPGQELNPAQIAAMRTSITKNLEESDKAGKTAGSVLSTTLTAASYASDGSALYAAGAKGNIPGQMRSYGYDLSVNAKTLKSAGQALVTEGLASGAGRSAGMSTLKATGAVAGRLAIPLTVAIGAYETYDNIKEGNRKGAYQAGTGTALSLGASIAAGAAVGTLVTPLIGTIVGAVVGVGGYYAGRYLGGEIADATDPKKDFKAAAAPAPYAATKMSVSFDPKMFQTAPDSQSAFKGAVKPAGVDVTKVAEPNTQATNDAKYKPVPVMNYI